MGPHRGEKPFRCTKVKRVFKIKFFEGAWEDPHRREAIQVHKVSQELLNINETTQMRESIQVHKDLGVFKIKFFEGAWEDPYRREAIQMLEVWQELLEIRPVTEFLEDPHSRKPF